MANNIKVGDKFRVLSDGNEFVILPFEKKNENYILKYTVSKTKQGEKFPVSPEIFDRWLQWGLIEKIDSHT